MVRTGKRAEVLKGLLGGTGLEETSTPPPRPQLADFRDPLADEMARLYRRLGGAQETVTLRPGAWDLSFRGSLVVELDEELHFNRYRTLTLSASWAVDLPWTAEYRAYCEEQEDVCLSAGAWGKRWTNPSCDRMFGAAGPLGDLNGAGAPRWKQRALYDAMKDAAPSIDLDLRMARVSVYDTVEDVRLWDVLDGFASTSPAAIRALVEARIA